MITSYFIALGKTSALLILIFYFGAVCLTFVSAELGALPVERKIRKIEIDTKGVTDTTTRHLILIFLPIFFWILIVANLPSTIMKNYVLMFFIFLVFLASIMTFSSYVILFLGKAKKLSNEKLRNELLALAKDFGVKIKDVVCIDLYGPKAANAGITGILPRFRYIFLTNYLLEKFDENEIKAVVAHELAHAKKRHLIYQGLMAVLWFILWICVIYLLKKLHVFSILEGKYGFLVFMGIFFATYISYLLLIHARLSLRFEKEADKLAAEFVGKENMIKALEKLAKTNLLPKRTGKLFNLINLHPSIEERIKFLQEMEES
jgi:STE24 endopeptidase